jgi:hypothetical protein
MKRQDGIRSKPVFRGIFVERVLFQIATEKKRYHTLRFQGWGMYIPVSESAV